MTSNLSALELVELFNAEAPAKLARMKEINDEIVERTRQISELNDKITREGLHSLRELNAVLLEVETHSARVDQLTQEADLIKADYLMDADAIAKALE